MATKEPDHQDILKEKDLLQHMLVQKIQKHHLTVLMDPDLELDFKTMNSQPETHGQITKIIKEEKNKYQINGNLMKPMITMPLVDQKDGERVQLKVITKTQVLLLGVKRELMLNLNTKMITKKLKIIGQELKLVRTGKILEIILLARDKLLLNLKLKP